MNAESQVLVESWIQKLEGSLSSDALQGKARRPSLHGFSTASGESFELPDYTLNLPRPLALSAAMQLMDEKGADLLAETGSTRICEGRHCQVFNTLLAFSEKAIYKTAYRPLYGAGEIADAVHVIPDQGMVEAFLERCSLADKIQAAEAQQCREGLRGRFITHP